MKLDIIGTGLSAISYDWNNNAVRWSIGSAFVSYGDRIDKYFAMHNGEVLDYKDVVTQDNYPLKQIIEKFDSKYFTCSISYMLAYAAYFKDLLNLEEINIYGVDMEADTEYCFERGSVGYWIGFLRGIGIRVVVNGPFTNNVFLYGYDGDIIKKLLSIIDERERAYRNSAKNAQGRELDQWLGASFAMTKIKALLRG